MFQRLKGAIDSRIAEEQARQRASQASPTRSASGVGRPALRDESPAQRSSRAGARGRKEGEATGKGPDPADFEPEFVVGDEDVPSRSSTPRPLEPKKQLSPAEVPNESSSETSDIPTREKANKEAVNPELPTDVRVKLRKLEKLESKYNELLRSYRIAHARVQNIDSFETSLKENTPLTSISDPNALVEYLNNINLKGDMVLDELKRVSSERDSFKQKLTEAEKSTREAWDEVANFKKSEGGGSSNGAASNVETNARPAPQEPVESDPLGISAKSPTTSIASRKGSLASLSIFSPRSKPAESPSVEEKSEDLFSFDNELPRMEAEIKGKQAQIEGLQNEVKKLNGNLAVTRESTQSMAGSLEEATRELNILRERKDKLDLELKEQSSNAQKEIDQLKSELSSAKSQSQQHKAESVASNSKEVNNLTKQLEHAKSEADDLRAKIPSEDGKLQIEALQAKIKDLEAQIARLHADAKSSERRVETLNGLVNNLREQIKVAEENQASLKGQLAQSEAKVNDAKSGKGKEDKHHAATGLTNGTTQSAEPAADSNVTGKKKNKKKKKGGKSTTDTSTEATSADKLEETSKESEVVPESDTLFKLQSELSELHVQLAAKDAVLDRIQRKLKDQDDLKEEIESLRDDLINVGQEHVVTKQRARDLLAERDSLKTTVEGLEKELADLKTAHAFNTAGSEEKYEELVKQFEELKLKASSMQSDLLAAEKLANNRFKDITELKSIIQKAQPELTTLRAESTELKSLRESLNRREADVQSLETKQGELQLHMTKLKQIQSDRDTEIKLLKDKFTQENNERRKAEEAGTKSAQQINDLSIEKQHATESIDRLSRELAKAREELRTSKARLQELEQQLSKLRNENDEIKEETELKTAQYASAQSLMTSMRDQTAEMATQLKEARERCESLDEEVAEAHRLLSERTREGETMRRLLADVEGRADARTREMKDRMDTAIEERDRAEDEASTAGRRRAREMEEMRSKMREAERNLKRAEDDKEELENAQRDWKRRREDLEHRNEQCTREAEEVRRAMGDLRDALDESERQARDLERQKAELKKSVDETQQRLEKLQKSNKSMTEKLQVMQTVKSKPTDSGVQSSRSSIDSAPTRSRLDSPTPKNRAPNGALVDAPNGQSPGAMDYVYLKNVLLQFLEQKDKKHQMQLIPVLGMLLHFDRKDEQKLMTAISAR